MIPLFKTHLVSCTEFSPSIAQATPYDYTRAPELSRDWTSGVCASSAVFIAGTFLALLAWRVWTIVGDYQRGDCTQAEASRRARTAFFCAWIASMAAIIALRA